MKRCIIIYKVCEIYTVLRILITNKILMSKLVFYLFSLSLYTSVTMPKFIFRHWRAQRQFTTYFETWLSDFYFDYSRIFHLFMLYV